MARNTKQRNIDVYVIPLHISSYGNITRLLCYSLIFFVYYADSIIDAIGYKGRQL